MFVLVSTLDRGIYALRLMVGQNSQSADFAANPTLKVAVSSITLTYVKRSKIAVIIMASMARLVRDRFPAFVFFFLDWV